MADVSCLIPDAGSVDAAVLVDRLRTAAEPLQPFDPAVLAFTADLSRRLRRDPAVRTLPAIGALAWWIRPAGIETLRRHWDHLCAVPEIVRVPRGLAFHIPPTNVDTMFVYSWLLSALAGNANVIRLSPTAAEIPGPLLGNLAAAIADHPAVAATTAIVSYGHDPEITAALSQADIRVIWGGDATIATIRAVPTAPHTTELAFPDRHSFAVLDADTVRSDPETTLDDLAAAFVNDAYWFDQLGCASPRLIIWRGDPRTTDAAAERFTTALRRRLTQRNQPVATSTVIAKLVHAAANAADGTITSIDWTTNDATLATLPDLSNLTRDHPGGGYFLQTRIDTLDDLTPHIRRRDQTMTHHGLTHHEITHFARTTGARGIDRIVPIGQALTFHHLWDGHDLLQALSRGVQLQLHRSVTTRWVDQ